mmetsp:Transcript_76206/g.215485  ORF Transcript_76206/g.215485 Transcript_76206/m.215485 type:complete len:220 (+) Transcript_76206:378-1037(+)
MLGSPPKHESPLTLDPQGINPQLRLVALRAQPCRRQMQLTSPSFLLAGEAILAAPWRRGREMPPAPALRPVSCAGHASPRNCSARGLRRFLTRAGTTCPCWARPPACRPRGSCTGISGGSPTGTRSTGPPACAPATTSLFSARCSRSLPRGSRRRTGGRAIPRASTRRGCWHRARTGKSLRSCAVCSISASATRSSTCTATAMTGRSTTATTTAPRGRE